MEWVNAAIIRAAFFKRLQSTKVFTGVSATERIELMYVTKSGAPWCQRMNVASATSAFAT